MLTTGIVTTDIPVQPLQFMLVDVGGQRNERRKWLHAFDDVSAVMFVVNLAGTMMMMMMRCSTLTSMTTNTKIGYNARLYEDQSANRMEECLNLFKATINNPIFSSIPIFLLLNKKDLFDKMIHETPITVCPCFRDYAGSPTDTIACLDYIGSKFKAQVQVGSNDRIQVFPVAARYVIFVYCASCAPP